MLVSGDVDQDNDKDLIVGFPGEAGKIAYFENNNGSFSGEPIAISETAGWLQGIEACDIDGDTLVDIVTMSFTRITVLSWYRNEGRGAFSKEIVITQFDRALASFKCYDLDNDGDVDIGAVSYTDHTVGVAKKYGDVNANVVMYYNANGKGDFREKPVKRTRLITGVNTNQRSTHNTEYNLLIVDVEGDSDPDFATLGVSYHYQLADANCDRVNDDCALKSEGSFHHFDTTNPGHGVNLYSSRGVVKYRARVPGSNYSKLKTFENRLGHTFFQFADPHLSMMLDVGRSYPVNKSSLELIPETQNIFIRATGGIYRPNASPATIKCAVDRRSCMNICGGGTNLVSFENIIFDGGESTELSSIVHSWTQDGSRKETRAGSPLFFEKVTFQNMHSATGTVIYSETSPLTFVNCTFQSLSVAVLIRLGYGKSLYDWQVSSPYESLDCGGGDYAWLPMVATETVFMNLGNDQTEVAWDEYLEPIVATRIQNHSYPTRIEMHQRRDLTSRVPKFTLSRFTRFKSNCHEKSSSAAAEEEILIPGIIFYSSNNHSLNVTLANQNEYSTASSIAQIDDLFEGGGVAGARNVRPCPPKTSWQFTPDESARCIPISCNAGYEVGDDLYSCVQCKRGYFKAAAGTHHCDGCPSGRFSDSQGRTECTDCPVQSSTEGKTSQEFVGACACDKDWYKTVTNGAMTCVKCPLFSSTKGLANASSLENCICSDGYYRSISIGTGGGVQVQCAQCPLNSFLVNSLGPTEAAACICRGDYYTHFTNDTRVQCVACPLFSSTNSITNVSSIDGCQCSASYYRSVADGEDGTAQVQCVQCPQNALLQNAAGPREQDSCACQANFYNSNDYSLNELMVCTECPAFSTTKLMVNATSIDHCVCGSARIRQVTTINNISATSCVMCPPGKQTNTALQKCEQCEPGTYNENEGQSSCLQCNTDTYNEDTGSTTPAQCRKCRTDYALNTNTNSKKGRRSREECVCDKGFFQNKTNASGVVPDPDLCKDCPSGASCDENDLNVETLVTKPSYWRKNKHEAIFYLCENAKFCTGGSISNGSANNQCKDGHDGPLCELCKPNYAIQGGVCKTCPNSNGAPFRVLAFFAVCVMFFAYNALRLSPKCAEMKDTLAEVVPDTVAEDMQAKGQESALGKTGLGSNVSSKNYSKPFKAHFLKSTRSKFRILVGYLQITSAFNLTFDVKWPDAFQNVIDTFKVFNVDVSSLFIPISPCAFTTSFINQFYAHMLALPIMFGLIIAAGALSKRVCWKKGNPKEVFGQGVSLCVFWVFLLYPGIGTKIFRMFKCMEIGETLYLVADFSAECYQGEHLVAAMVAVMCIFVYVIGIPFLTVIVLYRRRKTLHAPRTQMTFGMLYNSYKPQFWYFETVEMLRKMILAGGLVIIRPGTSSQILLGLLVALLFASVVTDVKPYTDRTDNILQRCCSVQVVLNLLIGLVLKLDDPATGEYETGAVGTLLVVMNVGILVSAFTATMYSARVIYQAGWSVTKRKEQMSSKPESTKVVPVVEEKGSLPSATEQNIQTLRELREQFGASSEEYKRAVASIQSKN
jgi:hypothetical protein